MTEHTDNTSSPKAELERARYVASYFNLTGPIEALDFSEKGNINRQTYLIVAGPTQNRADYILQLLNPKVFTKPHDTMDAMVACIEAQRKALARGSLLKDEEWETITLIPTREGKAYLELPGSGGCECWRLMVKIPHTRAYRSLREITDTRERLHVAKEAGRALALFGTLTAEMDASQLSCTLPGYRDIRLYYDQLFSVLAGNRTIQQAAAYLPADPITRQSTERHFLVHLQPEEYYRRMEDPQLRNYIALARDQMSFGLTLFRELQSGSLKKLVIHGDTKLENFLFSTHSGKAIALVDMDTIMPHTWLADWGDLSRSLANLAGEKESELDKVEVNLEVVMAAARGFLRSARHIASAEVELMADAAPIIALELGVRFLADYLRGDSYFQLGSSDPRDLNKTRARVQFTVFEKLRAGADLVRQYIRELASLTGVKGKRGKGIKE